MGQIDITVRIFDVMIDQLRQMAIFAKVIDHGSFRGAARELRLSPSVVSHHISQLEDTLGVALIYRSTRKLTLTSEGGRLLSAARNMMAAAENELIELSVSAKTPSGDLRLTLPSVLSQSPLIEQIAAFSLKHPRIRLFLDFSDTRRSLIDDGFDVAIRMKPNAKNSATSRKLFSVQRQLVASTNYLAKQTPISDPSELLTWDWMALAPVQNIPVRFAKKGHTAITLKTEARIFANDAQALCRMACSDTGLAILPEFLSREYIEDGVLQHVLPDWSLGSIDVFAEWPANAPKHGLIHLILDWLGHNPA
ncbi:LysR family transcriptional regulator [Primorskyibacter sp. S187A]|uniref:LysR family transcriptional regulator n=1 Tax=Primorskyibacter sp. S187A TaxID=3415130 RepID=UPI003C7B27AF